jgi:shikimate kinase
MKLAQNVREEVLNQNKPLVLVGLMGVGKTTVGRRLADLLSIQFLDADDEIEKAAGQSISDIFVYYGEQAFRDGEQKVIERLLDQGPIILATGGGALISEKTRQNLKNRAITIWLSTDLEILARRVAHRGHRPLLQGKNPLEVLKVQAAARFQHYESADLKIDTGDSPHARAVDSILKGLETYFWPDAQ